MVTNLECSRTSPAITAPARTTSNIAEALTAFEPISLAEMEAVALLDRTDTKYLLAVDDLAGILDALAADYRVLDIESRRLNRYRTVYFDTDDMALYMRHHAGNEVRQKVRSREYVESGLSFIEVKHKTNKDRTVKERLQTPAPVTDLAYRPVDDFLLSQFPLARPSLSPKLTNEFSRTTLVSKHGQERLTMDFDLTFRGNGGEVSLPGLGVVEVKQACFDRRSRVVTAMRSAGVPPRGISKYCLGVALLYPEVKHNNFKPKLLLVDKLTRGACNARDAATARGASNV